MQQKTYTTFTAEQFSTQPDFVTTFFDPAIGPARVLVPDGAIVEHFTHYHEAMKRYYVLVFIDDGWVGFHCGERTGEIIRFERESDAQRLCDVRNAARAARRSVVEVA